MATPGIRRYDQYNRLDFEGSGVFPYPQGLPPVIGSGNGNTLQSFDALINECRHALSPEANEQVDQEARFFHLALTEKVRKDSADAAAEEVPQQANIVETEEQESDRRERRLASNREAASRSRKRKQAYALEMEAHVLKLLVALFRMRRLHGYGPSTHLTRRH